ncbi:Druantia anti-phage system protein DruA [Mycobacterium sp. E2699]|uniref:Druantia anti-phage system protein DruA n=1 Tax=Mycobacterium sp. E2699 TaxID=1834137 RepID=UPI0018D47DDA|nr:Druantia anti-phage system protein DruA [Mycobacterium sp. E2699]
MSGSPTVRVAASDVQSFEPTRLGPLVVRYRDLLDRLADTKQSQMLDLLEREASDIGEDVHDVETLVFKVAVLVLRDYILAGYYPLVRDGRCFLANAGGSASLDTTVQRALLRSRYRAGRAHAFVDRGQTKWLDDAATLLRSTQYAPHHALSELAQQPPAISVRSASNVDNDAESRTLWRAVRATWSMGVEASAPGREVSVLVTDSRWPRLPLGILQLRNVVPEIRARDDWLATSAGDASGKVGFVGRLAADPIRAPERAAATRDVLERLLRHVNTDGLADAAETRDVEALGRLVRAHRELFDETRATGNQGLENRHLRIVKRAQSASDLIRGIEVLGRIISGAPLELLSAKDLQDLDAGLRKLWHYHMGFVAIELSICGAAPPFGPIRMGKLMAALAGSAEVISLWGVDRPLGQISTVVYDEGVRDAVPNPGPLVVFTSGLYPGHSAQYNRVSVGKAKWRKVGETTGFGSFHISFQTTEAMRALNAAADGYTHISRAFGEGSGARFRSVGRALSYAGLPDLRRHATRRPLYVLPLVDDPSAVILGWSEPPRLHLPSATEVAEQWWERWVRPTADALIRRARLETGLDAELYDLISEVRRIQFSRLSAPMTLFDQDNATGT